MIERYMSEEILQKVESYVSRCFELDSPDFLSYHNLQHTREVVVHAKEIGDHYRLAEERMFILLAAAWFHDLGFLYTTPEKHEEKSSELMRVFLAPYCPEYILSAIEGLIFATRYPTTPTRFLEEMICDADTFHFGTSYFLITDDRVKKEMEGRTGGEMQNWKNQSLLLLRAHRFYTSYCRQLLDKGKMENIRILESSS